MSFPAVQPAVGRRTRRRGAVLILTLWIAIVLGLVCYSMLTELRLDTRLTTLQKNDMKAFYAARAGVARAVVDLTNDMVVDNTDPSQNYDCAADVWVAYQEDELPCGPHAAYTIACVDEESKINLNTASYELLLALLRVLGVEQVQAQDIAAAIVDWRDGDTRPYRGSGQYESDFYAALQMRDANARLEDGVFLYRSKNDLFTTLQELLDVYGVTPELFYGFTKETRKQVATERRALRGISPLLDPALDERPRGLCDFLTIQSNGRINVNTAPREVLTAVGVAYGMDLETAAGLAAAVVARRAKEQAESNTAFRSIQQFMAETKFPAKNVPGLALDVRSARFILTVVGRVYESGRQARTRAGRRPRVLAEHTVQTLVERRLYEYPESPVVGDVNGVWEQSAAPPPWHKKLRPNPRKPGTLLDPVVVSLQWVEW